jgi:hypothetical protein
MRVSGANKIQLLKKGNKNLLLIGDYHYDYRKYGCSSFSLNKTMLVPEFIEKVMTSNPDNTWDFYLEQGIHLIDG